MKFFLSPLVIILIYASVIPINFLSKLHTKLFPETSLLLTNIMLSNLYIDLKA